MLATASLLFPEYAPCPVPLQLSNCHPGLAEASDCRDVPALYQLLAEETEPPFIGFWLIVT